MGQIGRAALKLFFETGDIPTQAQFEDLIDSGLNLADDTILKRSIGPTLSIPFNTALITKIDPLTITGATEFTVNTTDAEYGNLSYIRVTADGTNIPTHRSPFQKWLASRDYDNTVGVVNVISWWFDGISYWYNIGQGAAVAAPTLLSVAVASDNGSIVITGDKGLYANNDGTGDLQVADFTAGLAGGTATNPVLSIPTHSAGDSTAGFTLSYTGTADGSEVLTITPADGSSIYEITGVAMDAGESVNDDLKDQAAPTLTSATIEDATDDVLDFVFDEAMTISITGWNIDTDGAALSISSLLSGGGTSTPKFQLSRSVLLTETLNVDYDSGTGDTTDTATIPNALASITDEAVVNNVAAWTPADLGTKLLNWWDGKIVDVTGTDINNWIDQKGSIDFANNGNKATYDATNDILIFNSGGNEALESNANKASFVRSDGEYWIVFDHITNQLHDFICLADNAVDTKYWQIDSQTNVIRVIMRNGGAPLSLIGTTALNTGKNIIRVKSNGSAFTIVLNDVDISSEFSAGAGQWEDYLANADIDEVVINKLGRLNAVYTDTRIQEMLRCDENISAGDVTNIYTYLNAKY